VGNAAIGVTEPPDYDKHVGESVVNLLWLDLIDSGTGSLQGNWTLHNNLPGISLNPSGAFGSGYFWGDNLPIDINFDERLEFAENAEQSRVWVDEFYLAREAAPDDTESEVSYYPTSGAVQPVVTAQDWRGALFARWGIRGNVAGTGLSWFSTDGVGITEELDLVWPAGVLTDWVKVQFIHVDATSVANAKVRLFLNNTLAISRDWEAGTDLPNYGDSDSANPMHVRRIIRASELSGPTWFAARMRCRSGIFDQLGTLLSG